ncbi:MAG: DUF2721 domain-containing protein, partial [Verrucomicrobiae bacterium]|nr:DUF2721 domain-containing protein [Verrucomicrobiae bacterium]
MAVPDLVPILQLAVGPVIVISGVGLVLLSITNRFGRVIDRSRILSDLLHKTPEDPGNRYYSQLKIMFRRARLL